MGSLGDPPGVLAAVGAPVDDPSAVLERVAAADVTVFLGTDQGAVLAG